MILWIQNTCTLNWKHIYVHSGVNKVGCKLMCVFVWAMAIQAT